MNKPKIHQHLIVQLQQCNVEIYKLNKKALAKFLYDLVDLIGMNILIKPSVSRSKINAWTGLVGIVTSHISFHYWIDERLLQIDIYSCQKFSNSKAIKFIKRYWDTNKISGVIIYRNPNHNFQIKEL